MEKINSLYVISGEYADGYKKGQKDGYKKGRENAIDEFVLRLKEMYDENSIGQIVIELIADIMKKNK